MTVLHERVDLGVDRDRALRQCKGKLRDRSRSEARAAELNADIRIVIERFDVGHAHFKHHLTAGAIDATEECSRSCLRFRAAGYDDGVRAIVRDHGCVRDRSLEGLDGIRWLCVAQCDRR